MPPTDPYIDAGSTTTHSPIHLFFLIKALLRCNSRNYKIHLFKVHNSVVLSVMEKLQSFHLSMKGKTQFLPAMYFLFY